jgi:DNA-binding transcriptional MerR regulator
MGFPENEVAADNRQRRMEKIPKSPVSGVIENAVSLARPALVVASAAFATGASAGSGLVVAGSVVAGLGIGDWFHKLGAAKVNENLESLGQATEEALGRVEQTLREHGTSIDDIKTRMESQEFKDGMASGALQALRTTQKDRLNRMALILANGVKRDDLQPESLDDMMRAAAELKDGDISLLRKICDSQGPLLRDPNLNPITNWFGQVTPYWDKFINSGALDQSKHIEYRSAFSRLESHELIQKFRDDIVPVGHEPYALLEEGLKFYERLQEIAV